MASTNLPEDVVTDGEPVFPAARNVSKLRTLVAASDSGTISESSKGQKYADIYQKERFESGYGSFSSQNSLSSTGSSMPSLGSKFEPIQEKIPVQCSGDSDSQHVEDLSSKLSNFRIDQIVEDEGIESLEREHQPSVCVEETINRVEASQEETVVENFNLEEVFLEDDGDGDTILHTAILNEMISLVFALIQLCPSLTCLNVQNKLFQTPLHLAVLTNLSEIVRKLVIKGADVLMRDQQGNTALHIACRNGNKNIVETLVESVGNNKKMLHKLFTLKNSEGLTCLHIASQNKHYIIMGYLFAKGADVNIGDAKSGRTILHYAVERRDMETVKVLLTHKDIDVDCVTFKGESPLVIAYWRNYQDIVKKLRSKGAYFSFDLVQDWEDEENTS